MKHWETCEAPICASYSIEFLVWYADEKICEMKPYVKWQKSQKKIQKLFKRGLLKNPNTYYTVSLLGKIKSVRPGISGVVPDSPTDRQIWSKSGLNRA